MMRFTSLVLIWLRFAANHAYTPCSLCIDEPTPRQLLETELYFYPGPTVYNYTRVKVGDASELCGKLDNSKPTVVIVHGWFGTPRSRHAEVMISAYLSRKDHNVILFSWESLSVSKLTFVIRSTGGLGYTLATALNKLVACGLTTTGMHIAGHSAGAHIAGVAGRNLNFTLSRIIGVDPGGLDNAGPVLDFGPNRLAVTDAEFVIHIHTDRGAFGTTATAHADFYPNDGINIQPGCPHTFLLSHTCSHFRACYFFAQSVVKEDSLVGYACDSYSDFAAGRCKQNPTAPMGYATPTNTRGKFYLTSIEQLYGLMEDYTVAEELVPSAEWARRNFHLREFLRIIDSF